MFGKSKKLNARVTPGRALESRLERQKTKRPARHRQETAARRFLAGLVAPFVRLTAIIVVTSALLLGTYVGLAHSSWFGLRQVEINGAIHLSRLDILSAGGLGLDTNLIRLTSMQIEAGIRELPWIEQVKVERILPDKLRISVVEQTPYAIGLIEDQMFYLNKTLKPFAPFARMTSGDTFSLPVVSGLTRAELIKEDEELEGLLRYGTEIIALLQEEHGLGALSQLDLDRSTGIKIVFENIPATIKAGDNFGRVKLDALIKVVDDLKQRDELKRAVLIDLTLDKHVTVRLGQDKT